MSSKEARLLRARIKHLENTLQALAALTDDVLSQVEEMSSGTEQLGIRYARREIQENVTRMLTLPAIPTEEEE